MTDTEIKCRRAWHAAAATAFKAIGDILEWIEHVFQERYCDRPQARVPRQDRYGASWQERTPRTKR